MKQSSLIADASNLTKRRLRYAYYELLSENPDGDFSVSELTSRANISRATFYNHFTDIDEFKEETSDYLIYIVVEQLVKIFAGGRENIRKNCKEKNLIIRREDRLLLSALDSLTDFSFIERCIQAAYDRANEMELYTEEERAYFRIRPAEYKFFSRGFLLSVYEGLANYDYESFCKEINYIFDIWNALFPEKPM